MLEAADRLHVVGHVAQSRGERLPRIVTQVHAAVLLDALAHVGSEFLVAQLTPSRADHGEALGHAPFRGKRVQSGNELALGQVAGCAEDDDAEWNRSAGLAASLLQRVLRGQCDAGVPAAVSAFTG